MRRALWIAVAAGALLLGVGAVLVLRALGAERHLGLVEARLSDALGLEVNIRGGLDLDLFPAPHLDARDVTVENLPGRPSPHLLEIAELELSFDSWRLLTGKIEIDELVLSGVAAHVERGEVASARAPRLDVLGDGVDDSTTLEFEIDRLVVRDVLLHYVDLEGEATTLAIHLFTMQPDTPGGPLRAAAQGRLRGGDFALSARVGPLSELLSPTRPYPVRLDGQLLDAQLEIEGHIAEPLALRGLDLVFSGSIAAFAKPRGARRPAKAQSALAAHLDRLRTRAGTTRR